MSDRAAPTAAPILPWPPPPLTSVTRPLLGAADAALSILSQLLPLALGMAGRQDSAPPAPAPAPRRPWGHPQRPPYQAPSGGVGGAAEAGAVHQRQGGAIAQGLVHRVHLPSRPCQAPMLSAGVAAWRGPITHPAACRPSCACGCSTSSHGAQAETRASHCPVAHSPCRSSPKLLASRGPTRITSPPLMPTWSRLPNSLGNLWPPSRAPRVPDPAPATHAAATSFHLE